jgi:hypothetical protein
MRIINKPLISPIRTYITCYSSISDSSRKRDFRNISRFVSGQSNNYDQLGISKCLFNISTHTHVSGQIYKEDMKSLYENQMVKNKAGRRIYDKLMLLAPLNICPFCGFGTVSTLDHYLPKSPFPTYSVLPYNLIPCCFDCNKGKSASKANTQNEQTLHPYYDDYTNEQWLYASIIQSSPVSVRFYVNPPSNWSTVDKDRVQAHFIGFNLEKRFSIKAVSEFAILREEFLMFQSTPHQIKMELIKKAKVHFFRYKNSWETALYMALSTNNWYINGGYK